MGDATDGSRHVNVEHLFPDVREAAFDHVQDVVLADERHLQVQLGELRLAIGALVLVAIAANDLEVAIHPGHHQQLLVELG